MTELFNRQTDIELAVINDGNGEFCGLTYRQRCELADRGGYGLYRLEQACRAYDRHAHRYFETERATDEEIRLAAEEIFAYYRRHNLESAGPTA